MHSNRKSSKPRQVYSLCLISHVPKKPNLSVKAATSIMLLLLKPFLIRNLFDFRVPLIRLLQSSGDAADEIIGNILITLPVVMPPESSECDRHSKLKVTAQPLKQDIVFHNRA